MKKIISSITVILFLGLAWYLFLKPQDYRINFKIKSIPGTINQTLKLWDTTLENESSITTNGELGHVTQVIHFADSTHQYDWYIKSINDSVSAIKVDVKDLDHSFMNKVRIPFSDTDFEKNSRKIVTDFIEKLKEHQDKIKIIISGKDELSSTYCACVSLKSSQIEKAAEMMKNHPFLSSVIAQNKIALNGVPFIKVTNWDIQKDSITYDFCFPIIKSNSLPYIKGVEYKTFDGQKVIKATYNGNYITSDRAWYALLDYAKKNAIEVKNEPIEFFFSNPGMGDDELRWKAEIFLPLKNQDE